MPENKIKKILSSRVLLFGLLLLFIWLSIVLVKMFYKKNELEKEIGNLKKEIEKLDKSDQEMSQLIDYFSSQAFLEREAKDKLNLKKEGESVVMLPEAAMISEPPTAPAATSEKAEKNNFLKWWEYFFSSGR